MTDASEKPADSASLSLSAKCRVLYRLLTGKDAEARKVFTDYHLVRRKYVLSRVCEHFGIDKFEPAPLLNKTLLDVGCGTNRIAQELALRGANCLAIDQNPAVIETAKKAAEKYGAPVAFIQGKAEKLVQDNATYDIILCLDVLEESDEPEKLLWAMKKMLKPDGVIVFSTVINTPASWFYHRVLAELVLRWQPFGSYKRQKFLSHRNFIRLWEKGGFEISQKTGVRFDPFTKEWVKSGKENVRMLGVAVRG